MHLNKCLTKCFKAAFIIDTNSFFIFNYYYYLNTYINVLLLAKGNLQEKYKVINIKEEKKDTSNIFGFSSHRLLLFIASSFLLNI